MSSSTSKERSISPAPRLDDRHPSEKPKAARVSIRQARGPSHEEIENAPLLADPWLMHADHPGRALRPKPVIIRHESERQFGYLAIGLKDCICEERNAHVPPIARRYSVAFTPGLFARDT